MTTHLGVMVIFVALVSTVFATLMRDDTRDQLRLGLRMFAGLVIGALVIGWMMFLGFR